MRCNNINYYFLYVSPRVKKFESSLKSLLQKENIKTVLVGDINIGESKIKDYIFTSSCANIGLMEKSFDFRTYNKGRISTKTEKILSNIDIDIYKKNCNFSDHTIIGIRVLKTAAIYRKRYCYQLLLIKVIQEKIIRRMNKKINH
ncbi:hypothetical protein DMUE_0578 [Dictyocoela muelleri]|nr:hypothetical protein DMUE_0578 [Dictyocoela muelleri]